MQNNKGFTLVEILSALIILAIALMIGIVSVSRYIEDSKAKTYISQANKNIDNLIAKVANRDYSFRQTDTVYYVPVRCFSTEDSLKTAYKSEIILAYVVVTYDGNENQYYYTQIDKDNKSIPLTYRKNLSPKRIQSSVSSLNLNISIGDRKNIIRYPENCSNIPVNIPVNGSIPNMGNL